MKNWLTSKTVWFGVLQVVFGGVGYFTGWLTSDAAFALVVTGFGSVGLRFKTTEALK